MSIETFYQETAALQRATNDLRRMVNSNATTHAIGNGLAALATCLSDLSEHEAIRICAPLHAYAVGPAVERLLDLGRTQALHDEWQEFMTDWSSDCIEADIEAFAEEVHVLLDRIDQISHHANTDPIPFSTRQGPNQTARVTAASRPRWQLDKGVEDRRVRPSARYAMI